MEDCPSIFYTFQIKQCRMCLFCKQGCRTGWRACTSVNPQSEIEDVTDNAVSWGRVRTAAAETTKATTAKPTAKTTTIWLRYWNSHRNADWRVQACFPTVQFLLLATTATTVPIKSWKINSKLLPVFTHYTICVQKSIPVCVYFDFVFMALLWNNCIFLTHSRIILSLLFQTHTQHNAKNVKCLTFTYLNKQEALSRSQQINCSSSFSAMYVGVGLNSVHFAATIRT